METLKTSVCITVLNEEGSIASLITSLLKQTKKADEIIIVDGGSTDRTINIINGLKTPLIKLIKTKGTSIAAARNIGIKAASGKIIALTDAGCIPRADWLSELTKPFEDKNIGMVAGYYDMPARNAFQDAARVYLGVPVERFNPRTFLPSARSVAFKKEVWEKVGGFNEKLERGGEDTEFFYKCVSSKIQIERASDARVVWKELESLDLKLFIQKVYVYAKGDGQAGIWWHPGKQFSSHNIKISLIYIRYFIFAVLLVMGILSQITILVFILAYLLYVLWIIDKKHDTVRSYNAALLLPLVQIVSDFTVMKGFLAGMLSRK